MLWANNVFPQPSQYLLRHALAVDGLGQLRSNLARHTARHALKINVVAIRHVGHCGRGVDVCAIGSDSIDGRSHHL
jgi:hypothetical protein